MEPLYREAKLFAIAEQVDMAESCINLALLVSSVTPEFEKRIHESLMKIKLRLQDISYYLHKQLGNGSEGEEERKAAG